MFFSLSLQPKALKLLGMEVRNVFLNKTMTGHNITHTQLSKLA